MRNATWLLLPVGLLLGGCGREANSPSAAAQEPPEPSATPASSGPPAATAMPALPPPDLAGTTPSTDAWLGKWIGPEGTFLELSRADGGYDVFVQSLDGGAHYEGVPVDAHIEFTRAGKRESIQAVDGAGTGMKWLAGKHDCLAIQPGEGFCRD